MIEYQYGDFTTDQIAQTKKRMRNQIFFLLLIVDPATAQDYHVDINEAFINVLTTWGSLNELLQYPQEFCEVMALLNAAYLEWRSATFSWSHYRKLILDAGNSVRKIKEV